MPPFGAVRLAAQPQGRRRCSVPRQGRAPAARRASGQAIASSAATKPPVELPTTASSIDAWLASSTSTVRRVTERSRSTLSASSSVPKPGRYARRSRRDRSRSTRPSAVPFRPAAGVRQFLRPVRPGAGGAIDNASGGWWTPMFGRLDHVDQGIVFICQCSCGAPIHVQPGSASGARRRVGREREATRGIGTVYWLSGDRSDRLCVVLLREGGRQATEAGTA